ncbi:MAG: SMC-Scp complex subunit ScpB [Clostridia bacterium]|nr:SMC-Scp complex subunit ScpB [Clostridia bacterium]
MNEKERLAAFEAILFASGESVPKDAIAESLEITEEEVEELYVKLSEKYKDSGIAVIKLDTDYQLTTKKEYYEYVRRVTEPKRNTPLSNAALEALSIIAYKQPVTRSQVDYIRGVDSSSSMSRLINCGLIEAIGVSDAPGRPSLYATTKEFLRVFGLESLEDLPDIGMLEREIELEESDQLAIDTDETEEAEE